MQLNRFAKFAWFTLLYNLFVILWGAFVRATGSGAGCGAHWPTCNGEVIPRAPEVETMIEFFHRVTSGFSLIFIIILFVWALRTYAKGHHVRKAASFTMFFIITESLVGAALVLLELVAYNEAVARVWWMAIHLVNTFLLIGANVLTAWWASGGRPFNLRTVNRGKLAMLLIGLVGITLVGTTGAITALGDTLFPVESLVEGIAQDFDETAHFAVRLRIWHPVLAIAVGFYLMFVAGIAMPDDKTSLTRKFGMGLFGLVIVQLIAGAVNVLLLAPVWMQIVHLLLADLLWLTLVIFSSELMAEQPLEADNRSPSMTAAQPS
jgi:heme A synthase